MVTQPTEQSTTPIAAETARPDLLMSMPAVLCTTITPSTQLQFGMHTQRAVGVAALLAHAGG